MSYFDENHQTTPLFTYLEIDLLLLFITYLYEKREQD